MIKKLIVLAFLLSLMSGSPLAVQAKSVNDLTFVLKNSSEISSICLDNIEFENGCINLEAKVVYIQKDLTSEEAEGAIVRGMGYYYLRDISFPELREAIVKDLNGKMEYLEEFGDEPFRYIIEKNSVLTEKEAGYIEELKSDLFYSCYFGFEGFRDNFPETLYLFNRTIKR
ncbi:MAG: hypothetical protein WC397_00250 [Candidatus Paceibacterota bacterium]|jgi:hypothetical protein